MKKDQTVDYLRIVADYEKKWNRKQKEPDSIPDEDVYRGDTVDYMTVEDSDVFLVKSHHRIEKILRRSSSSCDIIDMAQMKGVSSMAQQMYLIGI